MKSNKRPWLKGAEAGELVFRGLGEGCPIQTLCKGNTLEKMGELTMTAKDVVLRSACLEI